MRRGSLHAAAQELGCNKVALGHHFDDAIGYCAFEGCHNLATLTFEGGSDASNLTSIDGGAFNNCSSLKTLVLPNRLRHIGQSAFSNCTSLTTVTLPDDLEFVTNSRQQTCLSRARASLDQALLAANIQELQLNIEQTNLHLQ